MTQRKGQFIFNALRPKLKDVTIVDRYGKKHYLPYANLHVILFNIRDEEFEKIERKYRRYIISKLHDPNELLENIEQTGEVLKKNKKEKRINSAS